MSQSRLLSFIESSANTVVGYATAIMTQLIVFPMFGIHIKLHENLVIGAIFTVISLIRGYIIRRFFNGLKFKVQFKVVSYAWRLRRFNCPRKAKRSNASRSAIVISDEL
jgi:hypothetical protein